MGINPDASLSDENVSAILSQFSVPNASRERLVAALKQGLPHNVLNAKNHRNEARIIAEAARPGAVTIATNMAGRGVDIILGRFARWRKPLARFDRAVVGAPVGRQRRSRPLGQRRGDAKDGAAIDAG